MKNLKFKVKNINWIRRQHDKVMVSIYVILIDPIFDFKVIKSDSLFNMDFEGYVTSIFTSRQYVLLLLAKRDFNIEHDQEIILHPHMNAPEP